MPSNTWVKVVGFSDQERHSLNTLFRLSEQHTPSYALWNPDAPAPPQVALIDVDSYEAGLEMASPNLNPNLKLICVGAEPPAHAWRTFQRPVDWNALVRELVHLFAPQPDLDIDLGFGEHQDKTVPPGVRVCLLVGMTREQRLYLRSRLALAGLTEVDDVQTAGEASTLMSQRHYALAVIGLELRDADPWSLVQALQEQQVPTRSVIVATQAPTWGTMERAEQMGCAGMLEIPFNPKQVFKLLLQV